MPKFTYTITQKRYFEVEADYPEQAREILEACKDLSVYETTEYEAQPDFEFFGYRLGREGT